MAPQEQTAQLSGTEVAPVPQATPETPAKEPEVLTSEAIDAAFQSKDPAAIEAARKKLFEPEAEPVAEQKPAAAVPETPAPAAEIPAAKKFSLSFHGEEVAVDDEDGWLGYGNAGKLKRSKVHADLAIERLKKQESEAREFARQKAQELDDLRRKFEAQRTAAVAQPAPAAAPPVSTPTSIAKPVAPVMPDLPEDPTDWTAADAKADRKYRAELADYNGKLLEYVDAVSTRPSMTEQQIAEIVEAKSREREASLRNEMAELRAAGDKERKALEMEREEENYWKGFSDFQSQHKEFGTTEPVRTLHNKIMTWMDSLADAYGHSRPLNPSDAEGLASYNTARSKLASAYLAGDAEVLKKVEGVAPPPKGYDTYFKLAETVNDLNRRKNEYVEKGELGKNASLHKVYLHYMDESGLLDQDINELRTAERTKGAEAVSKAIQQTSQAAVSIPNSMASGDISPASVAKSDFEWFYEKSHPHEFRRLSPAEKERYTALERVIGLTK